MGAGGNPTKPMTELAVPAMAEILRNAERINSDDTDFSWVEDAVTRWRAVALFGGLTLVEGLFLSSTAGAVGTVLGAAMSLGTALMAFGGILFFAGILITPAFGGEYAWASLGAAGLALGLGFYFYQNPADFVGAVAPIGTALQVGGVGLLALGLVVSIGIGIRQGEK
ncbi:MAG: hypothetical protein WBG19_03590 [Thermoplasmata archaeon]